MVWVTIVLVVLHKVPRDRFTVVGREELGGCMPKLAQIVRFLVIERVFERGVAVSQLLKEVVLRSHGVKIEGVAGGEDDYLLGEVAIIWIVETVCSALVQ
jgi:hypothetical protein